MENRETRIENETVERTTTGVVRGYDRVVTTRERRSTFTTVSTTIFPTDGPFVMLENEMGEKLSIPAEDAHHIADTIIKAAVRVLNGDTRDCAA